MVSSDIDKSLIALEFIYAIRVGSGHVGTREVMAVNEGCFTFF